MIIVNPRLVGICRDRTGAGRERYMYVLVLPPGGVKLAIPRRGATPHPTALAGPCRLNVDQAKTHHISPPNGTRRDLQADHGCQSVEIRLSVLPGEASLD